MLQLFRTFIKNKCGNVAISFALASVALVGVGGGVLDYASQSSTKSHLQGVVDAAVLVAANELKLSGSISYQASTLKSVAYNYIKRNVDQKLSAPKVQLAILKKEGIVDLSVSVVRKTSFFAILGLAPTQVVTATARAQIFGGLPLCVLAIGENISYSIRGYSQAKLTATGCSVHSNSIATNAVEVWGSAQLRTGLTCSAGGVQGGSGNFIPVALTDCPPVPDPLASRVVSTNSTAPCDFTNIHFSKGHHIFEPGKYCGGLKLTGKAEAMFLPGIYHIDGGQFEITGQAEAEGEYVGFTFSGPNGQFKFTGQSEVKFYAPKDGNMAGLLFYEKPDRPEILLYEINSPNIEKLVGTIYMPKALLHIAVDGPGDGSVAEESEFTVILVRRLTLAGKSNLVLNTDFAATDVPVPKSIERLSGRIVLSK